MRNVGLHIDVLRKNRSIDEAMLFGVRTITVGRSPDNTVVLPDDRAPRSVPLFHRRRGGFALHYTDETRGAVARQPTAGWLDLSQLHRASSTHRGGYDLDLREGARGQIDVGEETLRFEVVAAEPAPSLRRRAPWTVLALVASAEVCVALMLLVLRGLDPLATPSVVPPTLDEIQVLHLPATTTGH